MTEDRRSLTRTPIKLSTRFCPLRAEHCNGYSCPVHCLISSVQRLRGLPSASFSGNDASAMLLLYNSQEVVYEISIGTRINDLDLCLDVVKVMSTIALH